MDSPLLESQVQGQWKRRLGRAELLILVWAVVATVATFATFWPALSDSPSLQDPHRYRRPGPPQLDPKRKRNVVFMVSDGMGPASLVMTRNFKQQRDDLDELFTLEIDEHLIGNHRTRSQSSLITDSAAGATAFSCGLKSYNGAIGVDPESLACGTNLEAAKLLGYKTGLVVTTRITDATPACFAAHARDRSEEDYIAEQLIGQNHPLGIAPVDLMIGGGRCHFLPRSDGGCRSDHVNLWDYAAAQNFSLATDRKTFDHWREHKDYSLPLAALFEQGDIAFDLDRNPKTTPSLKETALFALNALQDATADSEQGFFLLIEGSRIDHASHQNDPSAHVREVLAYSETVQAVADFARDSEVETIVLSTSDHETGGLAVAKQLSPSYPEYLWKPEALIKAKHSSEYLARALAAFSRSNTQESILEFIEREILGPNGLNVDFTKHDLKRVFKNRSHSADTLSEIICREAQIGYSTHGHSAVDVNVYAYAKDMRIFMDLFGGNENIDIGRFMEWYLAADLAEVTRKLRAASD